MVRTLVAGEGNAFVRQFVDSAGMSSASPAPWPQASRSGEHRVAPRTSHDLTDPPYVRGRSGSCGDGSSGGSSSNDNNKNNVTR